MVMRTPLRHGAHLLRAALLALGMAGAMVAGPSHAAAGPQPLKADDAFRLSAARAADGTLTLSWRIAPGTYLYRDSLKAEQDGAPIALASPPGDTKDDPNFGPVEVYHHVAEASVPPLATGGDLKVSYQGCAEAGICYPVVTRRVDLASLKVDVPGLSPSSAARAALSPPAASAAAPGLERSGTSLASPVSLPPAAFTPGRSDTNAAEPPDAAAVPFTGHFGLLLASFLGFGLLLAFTPCVFPMLPILSGILAGGGARPTPGRGFALSGAYGMAMATAYGVLGIAAGWSGANLQAALQAPWALGLMAGVFVLLALSMFGLFDLRMPAAIGARLAPGGRGSLAGAAGLGFASALVVGPCVTPPLAAAMLYAAQTGDAARGGAALFMLGLGMALPLVLAGTFGAQVLPRSGPWLVRIKQACGVLFLAVAAVLAARLLPAPEGLALWGALAIGLGVFLGGLDQGGAPSSVPARLGKASGLVAVIYGGTLLVGAAAGAGDPLRPLAFLADPPGAARTGALTDETAERRVSSPSALDAAFAEARRPGRPVLVSFTAGWCTVCRSNEAVLADAARTDPHLGEGLARLARIAADVTAYGEDERALMSRFSVVGPPTLFLLDATGREVPGSRHIGALTAADLRGLVARAGL